MAAKLTTAVPDRMPVILHPDSYDLWLDPGFTDMAAASELLWPFDASAMLLLHGEREGPTMWRTMMRNAQRR